MMRTRFPSIQLAVCLLPWKEDLRFDEPLFREHLQLAFAQGSQYVYLMATAGEGYAVTDSQF
jgi:dihydrodipicolinate synthase/N-acetylneuraminate lyase